MTRPRLRRLLALGGGAIAAGACSLFMIEPKPPTPPDRLIFSHERHRQADVDCATCHEKVYEAVNLDGDFLPPEAVCMDCHEEEKQAGNCAMCHTDAAKAKGYPPSESHLRMSHAEHVERAHEDCSTCHTALYEPGPPRNLTPSMKGCVSCHEHEQEFADGDCMGCHKDLYDLKPGDQFSHQGDFIQRHASLALDSAATCAVCHGQAFCADCHSGTVVAPIEIRFADRTERPFVHRNDFVGRHSVEATAEPARCLRCHGPEPTFCENCHTLQNLTSQAANPTSPHPANWVFPPGAPNGHAVAARQQITNCASCHDQGAQSVCVNCHKVGGTGGNPHPPAWMRRNDNPAAQRQGMCLYCH